MVADESEAANDAGAEESYEHAFQGQQGVIDSLSPAFVRMQIHGWSCSSSCRGRKKGVNDRSAVSAQRHGEENCRQSMVQAGLA